MKDAPGPPLFPEQNSSQKPEKDVPHYHGHRDRLRQKFVETDGAGLADYEMLELLLCGFIPRKDVKPIAKSLLTRFGSLSAVFAASPKTLQSVDGIGETLSIYLKTVHHLHLRATAQELNGREVLSSWQKVQDYVRVRLQHDEIESFRVLFLDRKNCLISDEELGRGTVDHAPVYPREIAKRVLELSSSSIILVHNHPSGDPTPSRADISMTREIIDVLDSLEVQVHDHLVVGRQGVTSMRAAGLI
ncbi:RadC family protein [Ponticaulis koreensis]|uniref:RadC family protein n=1 Tax=Ponticaulis koreensis TaxID=1123045 RepID=UPI0003B70E4D|nr:DNA repair protein RadC [Ponticaulis koreensis]